MTRQTAIGGLTVLGLAAAGWGLIDAQPLVFAYTEAEYAEARTGRRLMVAGTAALAVAAVLLTAAGAGRWRAPAVAAPGFVCTALAFAVPPSRGGLALVLFLPLAAGALAGAFAGRRARPVP